jgi:hypothetical protein
MTNSCWYLLRSIEVVTNTHFISLSVNTLMRSVLARGQALEISVKCGTQRGRVNVAVAVQPHATSCHNYKNKIGFHIFFYIQA